mmetsp:Transcript_30653/g.46428  ORF Transcript_30653/g.46428 Transcript_30653/m.46428 type:complete len:221 (+) Transcript_30653:55-717(+)
MPPIIYEGPSCRHGAESPTEVECISHLEKEGNGILFPESSSNFYYPEENYNEMQEFAFANNQNLAKPRSEEGSKRLRCGTTKANNKKRKVSFSHVSIREHEVILGDHPCCEQGLPVTLGWDIQQERQLCLDYYEARQRRRGNFHLSLEDRRQILLSSWADTSQDWHPQQQQRQQRKLARDRWESHSQDKLHHHQDQSFFWKKPYSRMNAPMVELNEQNTL